jgi:hypothetical protein
VQRLQTKQQNGNCQGMLKPTQHALTIANFTIDQPAPLEINRKIATMGEGAILIMSKKGLSLFGVCLFFGCFFALRKSRSPAPKKTFWREDLGWTP